MKRPLRRLAPMLLTPALVACVALPASLSFARHRQLKGGQRRLACESFTFEQPVRVAKAGDTLWRLTGDNTGKPWIWPQIWTLNPELTNPHVLAVGQQVHFVPRAMVPAAKIASDLPTHFVDDDEGIAASSDAEDVAQAQADAVPAPANVPTAAGPVPSAPVVAAPPAAAVTPSPACLPAAFLSRRELRAAGTVVRSTNDGLLGGAKDRLQIRWPTGAAPAKGPWALLQVLAERGHRQGSVVSCVGIAEPVAGKDGSEGVVTSSREEIQLGQRVLPLSSMAMPADTTHVGATACGKVLAFEGASLTGSPLHLVFFDRGRADGFDVGSLLVSDGQGLGDNDHAYFRVLRIAEHTATLKPLSAHQELSRGQRLCGVRAEPGPASSTSIARP